MIEIICWPTQDSEGYFHAVFHHMYGSGTETQWWLDATGGHGVHCTILWLHCGYTPAVTPVLHGCSYDSGLVQPSPKMAIRGLTPA